MITHFAHSSRIICSKEQIYNGKLASKKIKKTGNQNYTFLYTFSDRDLTCNDCILLRIDFHRNEISKLENKLKKVTFP